MEKILVTKSIHMRETIPDKAEVITVLVQLSVEGKGINSNLQTLNFQKQFAFLILRYSNLEIGIMKKLRFRKDISEFFLQQDFQKINQFLCLGELFISILQLIPSTFLHSLYRHWIYSLCNQKEINCTYLLKSALNLIESKLKFCIGNNAETSRGEGWAKKSNEQEKISHQRRRAPLGYFFLIPSQKINK